MAPAERAQANTAQRGKVGKTTKPRRVSMVSIANRNFFDECMPEDINMVSRAGFEPATPALKVPCSTN